MRAFLRPKRAKADRRTGALAGLVIGAAGALAACSQAEAAETSPGDEPVPASVALATIRAAATRFVENAAHALATSPALRGRSGAVHVVVLTPGQPVPGADALPAGVRLQLIGARPDAAADTVDGNPGKAGTWKLALRLGDVVRTVPDVHVLTTAPLAAKRGGRMGRYLVGDWPFENGSRRPASAAYWPPAGLVEVTARTAGLRISEHLVLADLLTKGHKDTWPKYLVLDTRNLDKVELTLDELQRDGIDTRRVGVISGFRTPWYNSNGGSTAGRGDLSRHMYGDAIDVYIDADGDSAMDDLNGDGRVDTRDAAVIAAAAERVEQSHPALAGGIGIYAPRPGAHAGFVHIDSRGARARW